MDDMGGDCSTDGTCEADSGDPEMSEGNAAGEKVSLLQGTSLAIQQFSISKSIAFAIPNGGILLVTHAYMGRIFSSSFNLNMLFRRKVQKINKGGAVKISDIDQYFSL